MRVISIKSIVKEMGQRHNRTLLCVLIFAALGLVLGFFMTRRAAASAEAAVEEYELQMEEYEENLEEYDNSIQALEENLATVQQQYDEQKLYCEESIYMQLDSNAFWVGEVQYTVTTEGNQSNTINALTSYINGAQMRQDLAQMVEGVEENYLKEVLITSVSGNTLTITVYHYEEETAEALLAAVREMVEGGIRSVEQAQGSYSLELVVSTVALKADSTVNSTQNTQLNNLKTYTTGLADAQNSLSNKQQEKEKFIENTEFDTAASYGVTDWMMGMIKYAVLGGIVGIALLFLWLVLRSIYGKKLLSSDYLEALGVHTVGVMNREGVLFPAVERSCLDMELVLQKAGKNRACIGVLLNDESGSSGRASSLINAYAEQLAQNGIETYTESSGMESTEQLRIIAETGNVFLLVRLGETTYQQMDTYMSQCSRYGIAVQGAIVIE